MVEGMKSRFASDNLAYLRGRLALERHDWQQAVQHFSSVSPPIDADQPSWFDLTVAFHLLWSRALSDEPFDVTADDLTTPWLWFRQQPQLNVLRQVGALGSALALRRLGHVDLANRFAVWSLRDAEASPMESLADALTAVGLPTAPVEYLGDLDTLVDEMIAISADLGQ